MSHIQREFPYEKMAKYPGMRPRDVVLWERFIDKFPDMFNSVVYDAHVGDPAAAPEKHDEMRASGAFDVCQWCVDVIAKEGENVFVIEIKPNAGAGALGQALAYRKLLAHEGRIPRNAAPVVITDAITPILRAAAAALSVQLIEV